MNQEPLAIAYVPVQKWETVYEPEKALNRGTLFPALDKPFFATEEFSPFQSAGKPSTMLKEMENTPRTQEELMREIQETSFVLDELRLYLDTHPKDVNGLELLKTAAKTRKGLLKDFALHFYPLTSDCMAKVYESDPASECYCWENGPMPWEGACV